MMLPPAGAEASCATFSLTTDGSIGTNFICADAYADNFSTTMCIRVFLDYSRLA